MKLILERLTSNSPLAAVRHDQPRPPVPVAEVAGLGDRAHVFRGHGEAGADPGVQGAALAVAHSLHLESLQSVGLCRALSLLDEALPQSLVTDPGVSIPASHA